MNNSKNQSIPPTSHNNSRNRKKSVFHCNNVFDCLNQYMSSALQVHLLFLFSRCKRSAPAPWRRGS